MEHKEKKPHTKLINDQMCQGREEIKLKIKSLMKRKMKTYQIIRFKEIWKRVTHNEDGKNHPI